MGKGGGTAPLSRPAAPARTPHRPVHGKKKQAAIQQAQELRKAKKQLQKRHSATTTTTTNTHATENIIPQVSDAMVQHRVLLSCVDRIRSLLPKTDKPTPSSSSQQPRQDRGRDRSADIARLLPFQPLKRHVLWMTPKEQDASSTLTLTQELEAFADYVSVRATSSSPSPLEALTRPSPPPFPALTSSTRWRTRHARGCWTTFATPSTASCPGARGCGRLGRTRRYVVAGFETPPQSVQSHSHHPPLPPHYRDCPST
jgi:hypothetical protein